MMMFNLLKKEALPKERFGSKTSEVEIAVITKEYTPTNTE